MEVLKQDKITYIPGKIVSIYIVYETSKTFNFSSYPTLKNFLFGAVSQNKNNDFDKYNYSGYSILDLTEKELFQQEIDLVKIVQFFEQI